jgi:putative oxidoreductase
METRFRAYWPLPLRLLLGIAFLYHGIPKLGAGHAQFEGMVRSIGIPAPGLAAWIATLVEVLGGVALIVGAFVSIASALLIVEMLVAMFTVHLPHGFSFVNITGMTPQGPTFGLPGAEVNLLYIAALLALFIGGPGPLSVDERLAARERRPPWWLFGAKPRSA